jgi:PAS domain S-box-containing protein
MQYLDKSDTRLKLALQVTNTGMWEWDIRTGQVALSENIDQLFGIDPGRLKGTYKSLLKLIYFADRRAVTQAIARSIKEQVDSNIEFRIGYPDASIRWLATQARVYYDERSHPIKMIGVCRDITRERITGESLPGTSFEGKNSDKKTWDNSKKQESPVSRVLLSHQTESSEAELISTIAQDTTSAKQAEEARAWSEAKWRSLIQNSSDLITILSADGTILYESPAIERILGYSPEELIGQPVLKYIAPQDTEALTEALDKLLVVGYGVTLASPMIFRCLRKDGSWCFLESSSTNLLADEAVGGIVINSQSSGSTTAK